MIIVGYQGIGKSTLCKRHNNAYMPEWMKYGGYNGFIDLESSSFWVDGKRADDWYKPYCQIALDLCMQRYIVFTSSHACVQNYLKEIMIDHPRNVLKIPMTDDLWIVYPDLSIKEKWVQKLEKRYRETRHEKDFKAWKGAAANITEEINAIENSKIPHQPIRYMDYDLETIIRIIIGND